MHEAELQVTLDTLMPQWRSQAACDWCYLEGGYSNQNYAFSHAGERFVLRIASADVDRDFEYAWYQELPVNIGIRPLAYDKSTGNMVSPWVDGELLIDFWLRGTRTLTPQEMLDKHQTRLVQYLHKLHRELPDPQRRYELRLNMEHDAYLTPCHNDLNPWNIILCADGSWTTLDWEWVGVNDPLFDVISLHQGLELDLDSHGGVFDFGFAYCGNERAETEGRISSTLEKFWQREFNWASDQLAQGNQRREISRQQEVAREKLMRINAP